MTKNTLRLATPETAPETIYTDSDSELEASNTPPAMEQITDDEISSAELNSDESIEEPTSMREPCSLFFHVTSNQKNSVGSLRNAIDKNNQAKFEALIKSDLTLLFESISYYVGFNILVNLTLLDYTINSNHAIAKKFITAINDHLKNKDAEEVNNLIIKLNLYTSIKTLRTAPSRKEFLPALLSIYHDEKIGVKTKALLIKDILSDFNYEALRMVLNDNCFSSAFNQPDQLLLAALENFNKDRNKDRFHKRFTVKDVEKFIKLFVNRIAPEAENTFNQSLLFAFKAGLPSNIIELFIKKADVNIFDEVLSANPLMLAVASGHLSNVRLLLKYNANLILPNSIYQKEQEINSILEYAYAVDANDEIIQALDKKLSVSPKRLKL